MTNPIQQVKELGQSIWYDNMRRGLLASGELQRLIDLGVTGLTSNPTTFEKAISGSTDYDETLEALAHAGGSGVEVYEALAIADIHGAADLLRPVHDLTQGVDGYASLEVSPTLAYDTEGTVTEARRLFAALDRPNVMVKVPATPQGIPAVRQLIGMGININVTLIFSLEAHRQVMEAYISGLEDLAAAGGNVSRVSSVASFFISRVDTAVDTLLEERAVNEELEGLGGKAAIANARLAYAAFEEAFGGERFAALRARGARVQRPLWASTGTKNPAYSDVLYLDSLIGPDTVNTVPAATLTAFLDHGRAQATLGQHVAEAGDTVGSLERLGISFEQVSAKLLEDGVSSFADSFDKLLANITGKMAELKAGRLAESHVGLGKYLPDVESVLADLSQKNIVSRIWQCDHTVWKPGPEEISNRLGWLNVTDIMSEQVPALESFAREIKAAGFRHVALLGMGGSSLCPEVLRQTFGSAAGYPELIVLDSTTPVAVSSVAERTDPAHTLFLVSSKSGTTLEPLVFYRYFRGLVEAAIGMEDAGQSFVAITDPKTPLAELARKDGFRRVFLNPSDIGGRYSVLSYFGLVPAALAGIDVAELVDRAARMREGCASCVPIHDNHGAWFGAAMGALAQMGVDKFTVIASPGISSFGLWLEQLLAESTGKEGKGIVPVAGEPLMDAASYGDDRLFVYLRVEGDDNAELDQAVGDLIAAGQPVIRHSLRDRYDIGAEFLRWEFATSVAGAILGIQPFDQPNVQLAKDATAQVLKELVDSGRLPQEEASFTPGELGTQVKPGHYVAILAYIPQTEEADESLSGLRRSIGEGFHVATTLGYGPRYLHSTGQLHKGGPGTGIFLFLTAAHDRDLPIPGEAYTFGDLADAQALGDLRALRSEGRRVARLELGADAGAAIEDLALKLGK